MLRWLLRSSRTQPAVVREDDVLPSSDVIDVEDATDLCSCGVPWELFGGTNGRCARCAGDPEERCADCGGTDDDVVLGHCSDGLVICGSCDDKRHRDSVCACGNRITTTFGFCDECWDAYEREDAAADAHREGWLQALEGWLQALEEPNGNGNNNFACGCGCGCVVELEA